MSNRRCCLEQRIYKILGVERFKKTVLMFEKKVHFLNGRSLKNYHPKEFSIYGLNCFKWYVLYNCGVHMTSILFTVIFCMLLLLKNISIEILYVAAGIITVFNVYCILLQRYVFLKIKRLIEIKEIREKRYLERAFSIISEWEKISMSREEYQADVSLLDRVERCLTSEASLLIEGENAGSLERYASFLDKSGTLNFSGKKNDFKKTISIINTLHDIEENWISDRIVNIMRCIFDKESFRRKKRAFVFIENKKAEEYFIKIFNSSVFESSEIQVKILRHIYTKIVLSNEV